MVSPATTSSLLLGQKHAAFGGTCGRGFDCDGVGRACTVVVMHMSGEDRTAEHRIEKFGKKQIRNRGQLIPARRVSGNLYPESSQLLHQPPNFRTSGSDLLRQLGSADYQRRIA